MLRLAFVLLVLLLPVRAEDTDRIAAVAEAGHRLVEKHGAARVLLVFDIDNTLLTMNQDLGGDAWFNWQAGLLKSEPKSPLLVARDFAGLLRVQGILFSLSAMHPPEKEAPALLRKLQATGADTIALTSRGPEYYSATMRVLGENGYDFSRTAKGGRPGPFLPFRDGVTDEQKKRWKLGTPRPVMFQAGVYLAAGQHKGAVLREIRARRERGYKAILFADDHAKHVRRVQEAFAGEDVELALFRYAKTDAAVERFRQSDKREVARKWSVLADAIGAALDSPSLPKPAPATAGSAR